MAGFKPQQLIYLNQEMLWFSNREKQKRGNKGEKERESRFTFKEVEKADTICSCTICCRDPLVCFMEFNNCSNTWSLKQNQKRNHIIET